MRMRPIYWFLLSLMLLVVGAYVWHWSDEWQAKKNRTTSPNQNERPAPPAKRVTLNPTNAAQTPRMGLLSSPSNLKQQTAPPVKVRFPYRLSNTTKDIDQLARNGKAVLLRNALIDTETSTALPIPAQLRSQGDPGSYVVQSRGLLDDS